MGCDIHGVWECLLPNGHWVAFRHINDTRNYEWFGVLSGVRGRGPRCGGRFWDPRDFERDLQVVGGFWFDLCRTFGNDMHSHTLAQASDIKEANRVAREAMVGVIITPIISPDADYEPIPCPTDHVDELWLGWDMKHGSHALSMGIPLNEVLGLPDDISDDDPRFLDRIRFLCAYDN